MENRFLFLISILLFYSCTKTESINIEKLNSIYGINSAQKDKKPKTLSEELKKIDEGIGFIAHGKNPLWNLEIDFENVIRFNSDTKIKVLNTPSVKGVKAQDADIICYHAITEAGEIYITIFGVECDERKSTIFKWQKVMVQVKNSTEEKLTELKGCGRYIFDYRINDIWVLESIANDKGKRKTEFSLSEKAVFEFSIKNKVLLISTKCNNYKAPIRFEGSKIVFERIYETQRKCNQIEVDKKFISILENNKVKYNVEERILKLVKADGDVLTFMKID